MVNDEGPNQTHRRLCALCGCSWAKFVVDGPPLCQSCQVRLDSGELIWPSFTTIPLSSEERFEELFKTARVLLRTRVNDVDRIVPTLAFAHELGRGFLHLPAEKMQMEHYADDPEAWEQAADRFAWLYGSRPIGVMDGVLILERVPVRIRIRNSPMTDAAKRIVISLSASHRPVKSEQLAARYAETLAEAGVPHSKGVDLTSIPYVLKQGALLLYIERGPRGGWFPHPLRVREAYNKLLQGPSKVEISRLLGNRERGEPPATHNLIPACVAFYLQRTLRKGGGKVRTYRPGGGKVKTYRSGGGKVRTMRDDEDAVNSLQDAKGRVNRDVVQSLLNERVLYETWKPPLPQGTNTSAVNQLWRDAKKLGQELLWAADTFCPYDSEPGTYL